MKKLVTTTGGHPLKLDDLKLLQDANIEGVTGILEGLCLGYSSTGVILNGAEFSIVGPNLACSAGNIYWNGEIYPVDVQTVTLAMSPGFSRYWQVQQQVLPPSPATYQDTTIHNVHIKERLVLVSAATLPANSFPVVNVIRLNQILGSPKYSIMPYYGPTTHFNVTGDGIYGTPVYGYALCDGGTSSLITGGTFTRPNFMGKVLVGYDSSDADFNGLDGSNIPNETGGEKTHTLTKAELPKHKHTVNTTTTDSGTVTVGTADLNFLSSDGSQPWNVGDGTAGTIGSNNKVNPHGHSISGTTGDGTTDGLNGQAHNNLQPYHTVLWIIKLY